MKILDHDWTCGNCGRKHAGNIFYCQCGNTKRPGGGGEWVPLSSVSDWRWAIGRLAKTGAHYGTILYFVHGSDPARVTIRTHHGLTTAAVADCRVMARKGEHLNDPQDQ